MEEVVAPRRPVRRRRRNVDLYSLLAVECGATVIAIEPTPDTVESLRANIALNAATDVEVVQCALMDRSGQVSLAGPDRSQHRASFDPTGTVDARTLDEVVGARRVRGMKIDVEGNERLVLQGATRLLGEGAIDLIQLEWNWVSEAALGEDRQPVAELLRGHGFELFQADETLRLHRIPDVQVPPYGRDVFAARGSSVSCFTT